MNQNYLVAEYKITYTHIQVYPHIQLYQEHDPDYNSSLTQHHRFQKFNKKGLDVNRLLPDYYHIYMSILEDIYLL
jgi:hypothetical protein